MIKFQEGYIDSLITRFGYTTKVKFLLTVGYIAVAVLFIMNFILLIVPLRNIHEQNLGLEYLRELDSVAESIQSYLLTQKTQDKILGSAINERMQQLTHKIDAWLKSDSVFLEDIHTKLRLFNRYWNLFKTHPHSPELVEGFYSAYQSLKEQIAIVSKLSFDLNSGTSSLISAMNMDLPAIQQGIMLVLLNKIQPRREIDEAKEHLIRNNHLFIYEGGKAISSLSGWLNGKAADLHPILQKFSDNVVNYVKAAEEANSIGLSALANELLESSFKLNHDMQNLVTFALESEAQEINSILWKSLFILLFGTAITVGLYLTRVMRHPLNDLAHAAQEMSRGNIAIRVPITTKDEVAAATIAFNQMAEYFENILKQAGVIIDQIFVSSTTISSYTKEFESNMNSQERFVRQITSHAGSLQKGEEEFIEVLQRTNKAAAATGALAEMGHGSLHSMEAIMHEMLSASSKIVATLTSLREKFVDIHQVIFTIVKIADQSNLLSLNTAIRASKSGSEGRGFVIIADKIRELAEQIAFATLDIEKVVEDIVSEVQNTVQEVERFSSQILTQVKETTEIGNQLKKLIDDTQEQVSDFERINEGMQYQTKGIIAINHVIEELRLNVQESAYAVRKLHLEIEYLYDSSYTLRDTIKKYRGYLESSIG